MMIISGSGIPQSGVLCITCISQGSRQLLPSRKQTCQQPLQKASSVRQDGDPHTQPISRSAKQAAATSQTLSVRTGINYERALDPSCAFAHQTAIYS